MLLRILFGARESSRFPELNVKGQGEFQEAPESHSPLIKICSKKLGNEMAEIPYPTSEELPIFLPEKRLLSRQIFLFSPFIIGSLLAS